MSTRPVHIRPPEADETPLSHDERMVAIRDGWHPAAVAIQDRPRRGYAPELHLRVVMAKDLHDEPAPLSSYFIQAAAPVLTAQAAINSIAQRSQP